MKSKNTSYNLYISGDEVPVLQILIGEKNQSLGEILQGLRFKVFAAEGLFDLETGKFNLKEIKKRWKKEYGNIPLSKNSKRGRKSVKKAKPTRTTATRKVKKSSTKETGRNQTL